MQIKTKKAGVAILISDKIDFKTKTVIRDKEGHNDKRVNPTRDITFVNMRPTQDHLNVKSKY